MRIYVDYQGIDVEAYRDLQVAKYLFALRDINLNGYRVWKNNHNLFIPTFVDCEYLMGSFEEYGETHLGRADIHRMVFARDALLTKWTSQFNDKTMEKVKSLTKESVKQLWQKYNFTISDTALDNFEKRRLSVLTTYQAMQATPEKIIVTIASDSTEREDKLKISERLGHDSPLRTKREPVVSVSETPKTYTP